MQLILNDYHLVLIDRVVEAGMLGTTREEVLNSAALAHAKYLLAGESVFDHGDPVDIEVDSPQYGPLREEIII